MQSVYNDSYFIGAKVWTMNPNDYWDRMNSVDQANANQALEGLHPDQSDLAIQAEYILGTKSLADLLLHAKSFAFKAKGVTGRGFVSSQ